MNKKHIYNIIYITKIFQLLGVLGFWGFGADMGSIDPGPYYLGSGNIATSEAQTRGDLKRLLTAARSLKVPLIIGTAGCAGAKPHLESVLQMVREIAREEDLHFNLASIGADTF